MFVLSHSGFYADGYTIECSIEEMTADKGFRALELISSALDVASVSPMWRDSQNLCNLNEHWVSVKKNGDWGYASKATLDECSEDYDQDDEDALHRLPKPSHFVIMLNERETRSALLDVVYAKLVAWLNDSLEGKTSASFSEYVNPGGSKVLIRDRSAKAYQSTRY